MLLCLVSCSNCIMPCCFALGHSCKQLFRSSWYPSLLYEAYLRGSFILVYTEFRFLSRACRFCFLVSMAEPAYVIVYKGLGSQSLRIPSVGLSVTGLVHYLENFSDWLWGVGNSYKLVEDLSLTGSHIGFDHQFPVDRSCELRLMYLETRVTSEGFPCDLCSKFVLWSNNLWYTLYKKHNPRWQFLYENNQHPGAWTKVDNFTKPRQFFCSDCGDQANFLFPDVECVSTHPITLSRSYYSEQDLRRRFED